MQKDTRFATGSIVQVHAATVGISRAGWCAIRSEDATVARATRIMRRQRYDILPIVSEKGVDGYFCTKVWNDYSEIVRWSMDEKDVIPWDTNIRDVIRNLAQENRLHYFLKDDLGIDGLISIVHLNGRPVKVYLFNLLSELEIRLGQLVSTHVKESDLYKMMFGVSVKDKHADIKKHYDGDKENGLDLPLVNYLYLSDIANVILSKKLFKHIGYSHTNFKDSIFPLCNFRHAVAHPARSIITGPDGVEKLWHRIENIEDALIRLRDM